MMSPDKLLLPAGAWDCHVHVVDSQDKYPMVEDRQYTAGPATVDDLRDHLSRHHLSHAVIIQPSFYGTDNRCLRDTLIQMDGAARGIAVLPDNISLQEMRDLHAIGVRGIRLNMESAAVRDPKAIAAAIGVWAEKISPLNWHIQAYTAPEAIVAVAESINRLPVRFVLDHFAMIPAQTSVEDSRLLAVLDLLRGGNTYVKISAPYRVSDSPSHTPQDGVAKLAALFYDANPDRVLWGSDWPHTNREIGVHRLQVSRYRTIPAPTLTQAVKQWSGQTDVIERIFVRNPLLLYG